MGQQHVDMHRKVALRRRLLAKAKPGTAAYVPFLGDGDLALELYADRPIYGADLDPDRVATAASRLPKATTTLVSGDCDVWPFSAVPEASQATYGVGDFDAYAYPYDAFRAWWEACPRKANPCVLFFTDGQKQAIIRVGVIHHPDGSRRKGLPLTERRKLANFYYQREVLPWLARAVKPWRVVMKASYLRGAGMIYHGAVIVR